jgi:hypothetical protein
MAWLADRERENVYGDTYRSCAAQMAATEQRIEGRIGKGFKNSKECADFARDIHADLMVLHKSGHAYLSVNHAGYMLKPAEWSAMYGTVLFFKVPDGDDDEKVVRWKPDPYMARSHAKINGETTDGYSEPLYYRDYHAPYGYYDPVESKFNIARPFKFFARETGADTSHIYELINHIAGNNALHLLAWLRQKMCNPYKKTEVMPVFVGGQGTGKSTFGEVICRALFGQENVLVSYQYDSTSRFNADQADALVVAIEEKTQDDKRNSAAALKSSATATQVRKEQKGVDPVYQKSYTDYVMSTNDFVPLKFDDGTDQRRFMVMEADPGFTRGASVLADEVFTKLYGVDAFGNQIGPGLVNDRETVEQFKHELYTDERIKNTNPKDFNRTDAFNRCFSIPRTNESVDIEITAKAIAPFIRASLLAQQLKDTVAEQDDAGQVQTLRLQDTASVEGFVFVRRKHPQPDRVAVCLPVVFAEQFTGKPYAHSIIEKTLLSLRQWFKANYGLTLMADRNPPSTGFMALKTRNKHAQAAWFCMADDVVAAYSDIYTRPPPSVPPPEPPPSGDTWHPRYNERMMYDPNGCFVTLNEFPDNCTRRKSENAVSLDCFLLEADDFSPSIELLEMERLANCPEGSEVWAEDLYAERLKIQEAAAEKLLAEKKAYRVTYSGMKSLHVLVKVSPAPENMDERKWLDAHIKQVLGRDIAYDLNVADAARLTRYPYEGAGMRREKAMNGHTIYGYQRLLADEPDNVWHYDWRPIYEEWCKRPLGTYEARGKRMLPAKQVYKDAANAIIDGTFFTDTKWNGKRQETFFPAYRLVRHMGFGREEVWAELNQQIDQYYKYEDRGYWRTREDGDLIRSIDAEVDGGA